MSDRWKVYYRKSEGDDRFDSVAYTPVVIDTQTGSETEFFTETDAHRAILMLKALAKEHDLERQNDSGPF